VSIWFRTSWYWPISVLMSDVVSPDRAELARDLAAAIRVRMLSIPESAALTS